MNSKLYDIVIIGGGIVGCATAMSLLKNFNLNVLVIETEDQLAAHQTGNNSG
ncbi:MAG: FAD-dependent oxidoreductase, partial [Ignavibacteriaceae bacterium]|nr:FAD-dependent oxidoreductase [Ignavibacteriaceae bacterium]